MAVIPPRGFATIEPEPEPEPEPVFGATDHGTVIMLEPLRLKMFGPHVSLPWNIAKQTHQWANAINGPRLAFTPGADVVLDIHQLTSDDAALPCGLRALSGVVADTLAAESTGILA